METFANRNNYPEFTNEQIPDRYIHSHEFHGTPMKQGMGNE